MILAVMQPYVFPYLGYYQLAFHSDKFVFYDNVNFIKGGFINRNYILSQGRSQLFTLPVENASSFTKINQLSFAKNRAKVIRSIEQSYSKAPYVNDVMPIIKAVLGSEENNVAALGRMSIQAVFNYLSLELDQCLASNLDYDCDASAAEKLYSLCALFNADKYCNLAGGKVLYDKQEFAKHNIELSFLEMDQVNYPQGKNEFVPQLSMIDLLMWQPVDEVVRLLNKYSLS